MNTDTFQTVRSIIELLGSAVLVIGAPLMALWAKRQSQAVDRVHTLVNSQSGELKKSNMILTRQLAELTKKPEDIAAAEVARLAYEDHEQKQRVVDASPIGAH